MAGRHAYCCLLLMTLWISQHGVESMNLALNRPTLTSSTDPGSYASYAVDGDIAGTYYNSERTPNQWIRIDLGQFYFISKIDVYDRPALRNKLSLAHILLFPGSSPPNPDPGTWSQVLYQEEPLPGTSTPALITYNATSGNEPLLLARYIAVYNTFVNGLAISEVEVEGFTKGEYKPRGLWMRGTNASCVSLVWRPPLANSRARYEVRCDSTGWISIGESIQTTRCGFSVGQQIQCKVRVEGATGTLSDFGRTCADPGLPQASSFNVTEEAYLPAGSSYHRRRLRVDIPDSRITANCVSITSKEFKLRGDSNYRSFLSYRDNLNALTLYTVIFRATNSGGLYATREISIWTGELEPSAVSVTVWASSQSCVTLTWTVPSQTNGVITGYRYRCFTSLRDGDEYTVTSWRSGYSCGYRPGEYVMCQVSAKTAVGFGPSGDGRGRTSCANPVLSGASSNYVTEGSSTPSGSAYRRRRIRFHIPDSAITANCDYISSSESTLSTNINFRNSLYFIGNLSALTNYAVTFRATNNEGLTASRQFTVTTGELEPYGVIVTVQYLNQTCVTLSWSVPSQSNGVITEYRYRCSAGPLNSWDGYKYLPESIDSCGYSQGQNVTCQVAASTSVGFGPPGESTAGTACTKPTGLSVLVKDEVSKTKNGTEFITMVISQLAATANCDRITYYSVTVSLNGETIDEKSLLSLVPVIFSVGDLSPYTNYSITLRARNNEGLEETTRSIYLTKETRPSDPPSVQFLFTTSCVTLQISSPEIPNGVITHYQYNCRGGGLAEDFYKNWNGTGDEPYPEICKLESSSAIKCNVSAFNSAGESLITYSTGSTQLEAIAEIEGEIGKGALGWIVGGTTSGVLLAAIISIIVGLCIKKQKRLAKNDKQKQQETSSPGEEASGGLSCDYTALTSTADDSDNHPYDRIDTLQLDITSAEGTTGAADTYTSVMAASVDEDHAYTELDVDDIKIKTAEATGGEGISVTGDISAVYYNVLRQEEDRICTSKENHDVYETVT